MKIDARRIITSSSTALAIFLFSCSRTPDGKLILDPVPINLTEGQVTLVKSENTFAFDIFKKVLENSAESENVIISPLSISCALSMTLNGANGATRDSMLKALRVDALTPELINTSYRDLTFALLNVDKRVLISIANSVWAEKNFEVKIPFKNTLADFYNAESKSFDINDMMAYKDVNSWIENKTNGLITNMLDGLDKSTVMLLINAIYFKGKWQLQFDKSKTVTETFYRNDGTSVEAPMMKQDADYKVFLGDGFTLAELAYGQGNFVMDIILPDQQNGIPSLAPSLTEDNFNAWILQMGKREINLSFPRFKNGYKKELTNILSDMGMGIAFSDFADFSNIADLQLKLSMVLHQAFIETNEEGTEAAAATIVGIVNTSMPPPPLVLKLDHAFIYFIRETSTNSILFMGKVADPLKN